MWVPTVGNYFVLQITTSYFVNRVGNTHAIVMTGYTSDFISQEIHTSHMTSVTPDILSPVSKYISYVSFSATHINTLKYLPSSVTTIDLVASRIVKVFP